MSQEKPQTNHSMLFLLLIEAAMRSREACWREEFDIFKKMVMDAFDKGALRYKTTKQYDEGKHDANRVISQKYANEQQFNTLLYGKIAEIEGSLPPEVKPAFDNLATAFNLLGESLLNAPNSSHLLYIVELYNRGYFNDLIEQGFSKEQEKEQKSPDHHYGDQEPVINTDSHLRVINNKTNETSDLPSADHHSGELQENNNSTTGAEPANADNSEEHY